MVRAGVPVTKCTVMRIRIRIYLLARMNLLWDILRLPSSRRAAPGLYVILTLRRGWGANQPPYALLHWSSPRYALHHGRRHDLEEFKPWLGWVRSASVQNCSWSKTIRISLTANTYAYIRIDFHQHCCNQMSKMLNVRIRIRIRIRIYLLARRNLLWDILRLPSSRRAALGLCVIITLWRGRGANQPPYTLLHMELAALRTAPRETTCYVLISTTQRTRLTNAAAKLFKSDHFQM